MSKTPYQRAAACFALARSTTHASERSAAIGRGEAICRKHGLELALFDIPGRSGPAGPRRTSAAEFVDETIRRAWAAAGASSDEDLETARRRNFAAAAEDAKARDARRAIRQAAQAASRRLFRQGVRAYPGGATGTKPWIVYHGGASVEVTHEELIELDRAFAARAEDARQHLARAL